MNIKGIIVVIVLIGIVGVTGYFVYLGTTSQEPPTLIGDDSSDIVDDTTVIDDSEYIEVARTYVGGVHTYLGEINLPTPCHVLEHSTVVKESFPEQVDINFTYTSEAEMCAQVITPEPFEVSFSASRDAVVTFMLNGEKIEYKVIEGGVIEAGDSLDEVGTSSATTSDEEQES